MKQENQYVLHINKYEIIEFMIINIKFASENGLWFIRRAVFIIYNSIFVYNG